MWWHSREDPVESSAAELTRECEALIAGDYADLLRARGRWAPPWAWVNALAHGTEEQLQTIATGAADDRPGEAPGTREWRVALAFLADDVLRHVRSTGTTLRQVQLSKLIPLELQLMRHEEGRTLNVGQLAGTVLAAVHDHPSRRQP